MRAARRERQGSPWFGPHQPPSWADYHGSGAVNAGPAGASAGATTRTTSCLSWSRRALRAFALGRRPRQDSSAGFGKRPSRPRVRSALGLPCLRPLPCPPQPGSSSAFAPSCRRAAGNHGGRSRGTDLDRLRHPRRRGGGGRGGVELLAGEGPRPYRHARAGGAHRGALPRHGH